LIIFRKWNVESSDSSDRKDELCEILCDVDDLSQT
jgi:hypothetical protein